MAGAVKADSLDQNHRPGGGFFMPASEQHDVVLLLGHASFGLQ